MDLKRCLPPSQNAACDLAILKKSLDFVAGFKSRKFLSETDNKIKMVKNCTKEHIKNSKVREQTSSNKQHLSTRATQRPKTYHQQSSCSFIKIFNAFSSSFNF